MVIMISAKKIKGRKPQHEERNPGDQNMLNEEKDEQNENMAFGKVNKHRRIKRSVLNGYECAL